MPTRRRPSGRGFWGALALVVKVGLLSPVASAEDVEEGEAESFDELYNPVEGDVPSASDERPPSSSSGEDDGERALEEKAPARDPSTEQKSAAGPAEPAEDTLLSRALSWRRRDHQVDIGLLGTFGVGVCHFLVAPCGVTDGAAVAVPWIAFGPGVGLRARYRYQLSDNWGARFEVAASFGSSKDGTMLGMFGSYGGTAGLYYRWIDVGWIALFSEAHVGIRSISLIPVPLYGIGHELSVYPLAFWDQPWVSWDITGGLSTDLLVIAPAPSVFLRTLVTVAVFGARVGVEVRGDADAAIAVFTNSAGATVGARLVVGYAL